MGFGPSRHRAVRSGHPQQIATCTKHPPQNGRFAWEVLKQSRTCTKHPPTNSRFARDILNK
eukprot:8298630-Pyramimonas_sp.AAC.1